MKIKSDFEKFKEVFLEENSKHNLISKNDEKFLYEKHFFDSLGVKLFFEKYKIIGTNIRRYKILGVYGKLIERGSFFCANLHHLFTQQIAHFGF